MIFWSCFRKNSDHEYEPIQAPAQRAASQPDVRSTHVEENIHRTERLTYRPEEPSKRDEEERYEVVKPKPIAQPEEVITILQTEGGYEAIEQPKKHPRRFFRIPNEDAVIIPLHGSSDEEINPDRYRNPALMVSEDEPDTPVRTKMPVIQVHSPESTSAEQAPQSETFQDRIKSQADKFRSKLKGISKPKITMPQRPKIKLPERPNIKMPEMPKFKLPERPKFNLPERPKFNFPDRPKFHLPERPKFHMPEKPKFLTERPKFKFGSEKKPKPAKGKKPNPSSLRRPLRDVVTISSQSTPGSTQNIFDTFKFRTYPRFFKKKKKEQLEQKMSSFDTESSPSTPPQPRVKAPHQDTEWVTAYSGLQYADEEEDEDVGPRGERIPIPEFATMEKFSKTSHDDYLEESANIEASVAKAESMNSVVSEKGSSGSSSMRRRAGVIEEIDSDEFFVRQKGLSREDVDVSRYLSLEIRDAFRQPKNALASLDNDLYDEDEPEIKFSEIPRAPQRKKSIKSTGSDREKEFHTFPKRPSRRKESDPEKPPRRFRSRSGGRFRNRQSSMPSLERDLEVEGTPEPPQRRKSTKSLNREEAMEKEEDIVQTRVTARNLSSELPPVAPLRKSRSRGTSLADDDRTSRGADSAILPDDDDVEENLAREIDRVQINVVDEIKVEEPLDEDIDEEDIHYRAEPMRMEETTLNVPDTQTELPGYAVVTKDKKKPPRPPLPPRAHHFDFHSQIDNIKSTGKNIFFTYPRRAIKSLHKTPVRPTRNYSTLGPLRPPRRNRVFRQPVYMKGDATIQQEDIIEKERDLQSGEVVMRMKGRPLPPPPRPPRRTKDYDILAEVEKNDSIPTETETIVGAVETEVNKEGYDGKERLSYLKSKKDEFFNSLSRIKPLRKQKKPEESKEELIQTGPENVITTSQQTSFDIAEVSVSIQTDPLPKDVIVIDQEIEETQEILIVEDTPIKVEYEEKKSEIEKLTPVADESSETNIQLKESVTDLQETNIFQHALERVEAARGVLQEARERVIPGSLSLRTEEKKTAPEVKESSVRVIQKEALSTSSRSEDLEKEGTPPPLPTRPLYTKPVPVSFPDKLHLSELEVERLNVSELQASKIKVSEIETASLDVTDINARSGNLNLSTVELPPDFISNIVAQVMSQTQQQQASSQKSRESTPLRQSRTVLTPPPSIVVQATSEPVKLPEPSIAATDVREHIPQPRTTRSKGRRSPTRVIDDSEDELASTMPMRRKEQEKKDDGKVIPKLEISKSEASTDIHKYDDPSVPTLVDASSLQLMRQLFSIWQDYIARRASSFVEGVNSLFPEGEKRRDAQIAAVILLILITGLVLIGYGFDNSVHHHHWDYLPPR
nr:titin isoform X2 [Halyomorpha halys]